MLGGEREGIAWNDGKGNSGQESLALISIRLCLCIDYEGPWRGEMAKLTAAARRDVPKSKFGIPGRRAYPMPDRSHAANAKARATQMVKKGKLSPASASKIRAKANRILGRSK